MKCQSRCIKRMQFYAVLSNACEFLGRHILVTQEVDFRMTEKQQIAKKLDRPLQKLGNQKCSFLIRILLLKRTTVHILLRLLLS